MSAIQLAFLLFAACLLIGLFMPSWWCLLIALGMGVALWLEDREHRAVRRRAYSHIPESQL